MTATAPVREIGYAHALSYGGYWWMYDDEQTPELVWPNSVIIYDAMRRTDSQVASVLRAVTLPVRRTPWRIDPNGARDEVVELVATDLGLPIVGEEAPEAPTRMRDRFSWPEHLRQALLMLPFGHSFFEIVFRVDEGGNRAHLRKLAPRPAKTIEKIEVARDGGLISIKQYPSGPAADPQKPIPVARLVGYIHDREGGNWLGTSVLRPAYKNWLLKDRLLRVQAQTIERNGMGIPLYKAQEGASEADIAAGRDMATAWRAGEAAGSAVPFGADLVLRGVEGTLPDAEKVVRYHDEQVARAVLAHFLNLGTQTGSWALGTTFADFFTLSLQTLAQQIADTATMHVIEDLVDVNWGPDEPAPRLVFDEIGSRQAATAQALKSLIDAGAIQLDGTLEEMLRQQYGLPPKDPATARADEEAATDSDAMVAAIDAFRGGKVAAAAGPDFDRLHPRGAKGRFRTTFDRLLDALQKWQAAGAKGHPFAEFKDREPLRRTAVKLGIDLPRAAKREYIADALLAHIRDSLGGKDGDKPDVPEAKPDKPAPKKRAPAKKAAPKLAPPEDIDSRVRDIYHDLATRPGSWVPLADVRDRMGDVDRGDLDAALTRLAVTPGVHVIPWDNRKALTQRDRDASVRIGGDETHALRIDEPAVEPDSVQLARQRQADIDDARRYADLAAELDELTNNEASDATLLSRLDSRIKREGLGDELAEIRAAVESGDKDRARALAADLLRERGITQDSSAGTSARFDPKVHQPIDGSIRQGQAVEVVRPGFTLSRDGETIRIRKAVVEEADEPAAEAAPESLDPEALRDSLDLKKLPELKSMIREHNARTGSKLKVSGRKRELVDRLVEAEGGSPASVVPRASRRARALTRTAPGRIDVDLNAPRPATPTVPEGPELGDMDLDELLDLFGAVGSGDTFDEDGLRRIDAELARREQGPSLPETPEQHAIDDLVARGRSYRDAYAEVYDLDPEQLEREELASLVDGVRAQGETREQAVRRLYDEATHLSFLQAEDWTRGTLLNGVGRRAGVDPLTLFSGSRARARKYASEELKRFWAEVESRLTYTEFRALMLGRLADRRSAARIRHQGQERDFGL